jgi:hypothetical protein
MCELILSFVNYRLTYYKAIAIPGLNGMAMPKKKPCG